MGNYFDFKCEECDFTAQCSHGRDRGLTAIVQPLYCSKCKVLKNIHIGKYVVDKTQITGQKIEKIKPICTQCYESSYLQLWDGRTCPQCRNEPLLMKDAWICWD
jgi:hypothetical protein